MSQEIPDDQLNIPVLQLDPTIYTAESEQLMRQRGILQGDETMPDALNRVTDALLIMDAELAGGVDASFNGLVIRLVNEGVISYGTPILTNAGREQRITAACTVLPIQVNHGRVNVKRFAADSAAALDRAVGTGYDLSEIDDPAGALAELNRSLNKINAHLVAENQRPVASMATLRADHPGVVDFVRAKREADFSQGRFNLSVFVTEDLFRAAEQSQLWELKDGTGKTVSSIDANELLLEIADCAHYCGEPGVLFQDRMNADNPTPQWEYKSTAPCAEVAMAAGEACQFSYINVASLVDENGFNTERFGVAVRAMTRLLDASVEYTIRNSTVLPLPLVEQKRRIGVGLTGFADLLIKVGISYESPEAVQMAAQISELLDYHSKVESVALARQRGAFPAFAVSRFVDPKWRERKLPLSTGAVSRDDWERLYADISQDGIRHASTTAMPPTGTSSEIVGSSKSLEPYFSLVDPRGHVYRTIREAISRHQDHDYAEQVLGSLAVRGVTMLDDAMQAEFPYIQTARQITPAAHLNVQAGFQRFLDESLAKTVNLPESASIDDVLGLLWESYRSGVKGITIFRDNCLATRGTRYT